MPKIVAIRPLTLNGRGFTLIELIVTMVLIAMIASFAVPQIGNFIYADRLKVTTRKLVALIHRSSQLAQRQQASYLLTYQQRDNTFVVEPEIGEKKEPDRKKENRLQLTEAVAVRDLWSWYGGLLPADAIVIRFSKNGYVEPTIIHLRKDDGQEMSVVLSPFLGKVQVMDGYVLPEKENLFQ
jgi:prepilin-type N-terminal cleavage/methylation domain-containing protein